MNSGDTSTVWTRRSACISALHASEPSDKQPRPTLITSNPLPQHYASHNAIAVVAGGGRNKMLHYAVVFFIIAIIAAILGFGGIAAGAAGIAKILFFVFLVLALITFLRRA